MYQVIGIYMRRVERIIKQCFRNRCTKTREFTITDFDRMYASQNKKWQCNSCGAKERGRKAKELKRTNPDLYQERLDSQSKRMKKWHQENPDKSSEIGKKRRKKVSISGSELRRRQQETINNNPELYKKYCEKRKQIALDFHKSLSDEEKSEHYKKVFKNTGSSKECDNFITEIENKLGISIKKEEGICGFIVDGLYNNVIFEYYGSTFHCSPLKFDNPRQYCPWIGRTVQEQWDRDRKRLAVFYSKGYKVVVVWDHEWKKTPNHVLERIKNALRED